MFDFAEFRAHLKRRQVALGAFNPLRYLGPGLLVAVGFIDPGNWASNLAAGSGYGHALLWVVTLSTLMLIMLQHNAAHLGIVTGDCLAEATTRHLPGWLARPLLVTALFAVGATAFAELIGAAIALKILFHVPMKVGLLVTVAVVVFVVFLNTYRVIEKIVVGFVSLIGIGFLFEVHAVGVDWPAAAVGWVFPRVPDGAWFVTMSVLGAVVMPHNLFLHSEFIQSRQLHLQNDEAIRGHLRFELMDTLFSMTVGFAINSAMVLLAAAAFFHRHIVISSLEQAETLLRPMFGHLSAWVFGVTLLLAGLSASVTAAMAGGTIVAGLSGRPYEIRERRSRVGVLLSLSLALLPGLFVNDSYRALVLSQVLLSVQLPCTVLLQLYLTSSRKIMGNHANAGVEKALLWMVAAVVVLLNVMLAASLFWGW